jgi:hypothetical protein
VLRGHGRRWLYCSCRRAAAAARWGLLEWRWRGVAAERRNEKGSVWGARGEGIGGIYKTAGREGENPKRVVDPAPAFSSRTPTLQREI